MMKKDNDPGWKMHDWVALITVGVPALVCLLIYVIYWFNMLF
jgi:hypothetical protein